MILWRRGAPDRRHREELEAWEEVRVASTAGWRALDRAIGGDVLLPGSREFDIGHPALNARFDDVRPQAVVRCRSSKDVVETIRFAHGAGMELATRNGGHCFGGRSSTKGLLVDVTPCLRARAQPGQGLWSSRKAMELVNLTSPSLAEVIDEAHQGIDRFAARPAWPTRSWVALAWPTPS
jgi:hypothetical protein